MANIQIYYSPNTCDNIIDRVLSSVGYSNTEKDYLKRMLIELKKSDYLLYAIEILEKQVFPFEVPDFDKYKESLISEVYSELIDQLINEYTDYEEVSFSEVRQHFSGMQFDINLLNTIDRRFNATGITVVY